VSEIVIGSAPFRSETKDDRQHCEQADQGIKLIRSDVIRLNAKKEALGSPARAEEIRAIP
jgi:hypothetical protein